ncbi:ABC-3 protein [Sulfuricella denitrificans skB26]|uniref:ABC-3 protein n=1 Tax=Sulfuricella denitrificans (strain DSM 22764 / NBRC 105220 / skB26) TaxID=1163617 RepID=S6AEG4_SULDS|nr:metal ABC transporter permease [Sulfuricella denitrificans]BAN34166.1 ABC-3 protein [Sulfuricella denitrificans skB26]
MNLDALSLSILVPAFLAGLLVLATHVPMGMQVLSRSIVFIDLAIAQIATLGVIAADLFGFEPEGWVAQVAAVSAALLGALLLTWTERRWPDVQEALIGVLFVLAASGGMLLVANNPHGGEHLRDLLAGQILWVSTAQLLPVAALAATILILWFGLRDRLGRFGFYGLFAFAVTTSVQLVGVYLVFASLIVPALACRLYSPHIRLAVGYAVGAAGYILGLGLSVLFDLPSGAVVVWTLALVGIAAYSLGPDPSRSVAK